MKKRKLLSLLVLLMTAATGAWAEDTYKIVFTVESTDFVIGNATLPYTKKIKELYPNASLLQDYSAEILSVSGDNIVKGTDDGWNTEITINDVGIGSVSVRVSKGDYNENKTITIDVTKNPIIGYCGDPEVHGGQDVTYSLTSDGVLTISGTGAMEDYATYGENLPWADHRSDIKAIVINNGVTSIGNWAFDNCQYVTSVSIPASVTSIGYYSFNYCSMTTLTFAENSSLETIGSFAFNCAGLPSVTFPASLTSIGSHAFDGCVTSITLNSYPSIGESAFPVYGAVTMNLTAKSAGGAKWMTFYNENYNFQADAYTQVFKVALSGDELTMNKVNNGIVDKNTAVVLKTTGDGNPVMTLTTTASGDEQANSLKGVSGVSDAGGKTSDGKMFVLNNGSQGVGFYKLATGSTVGVGKAYLTYSAGAREFFGFGEATSLSEELRVKNEEFATAPVYDLQGRRVQNPSKGLYIVNGKLVVKK